MFFEKGWCPLSRVAHDAMSFMWEHTPETEEEKSCESDHQYDKLVVKFVETTTPDFYAFMWDMLYDFANKKAVGCTKSAGRTLLVDEWLVYPMDPGTSEGMYIDLFEGFVGSGKLTDQSVKAFEGMPIVLRDARQSFC